VLEELIYVLVLIKKVQDDYYGFEYSDYFKEKHWFQKIENSEYSTWESEPVWDKFDDYIKKYPLIHKRVLSGEGPFKLKGSELRVEEINSHEYCSYKFKKGTQIII
jgi:hypothetical protein